MEAENAKCQICWSIWNVILNGECEHALCAGCRGRHIICPMGKCLCRLDVQPQAAPQMADAVHCDKCNALLPISSVIHIVPCPHSIWEHESQTPAPIDMSAAHKLVLPTTKPNASDKIIVVPDLSTSHIFAGADLALRIDACTVTVLYCHRSMRISINDRLPYTLLRGLCDTCCTIGTRHLYGKQNISN